MERSPQGYILPLKLWISSLTSEALRENVSVIARMSPVEHGRFDKSFFFRTAKGTGPCDAVQYGASDGCLWEALITDKVPGPVGRCRVPSDC